MVHSAAPGRDRRPFVELEVKQRNLRVLLPPRLRRYVADELAARSGLSVGGVAKRHFLVRLPGPFPGADLAVVGAPRGRAVRDCPKGNRIAARSVLCAGHVQQPGGEVPVQPDGGEARVKRKGGTARDCLKEAWSEIATRRTETGYEAAATTAHRLSAADHTPRVGRLAFHPSHGVGTRDQNNFAAQWLACTYPYRRFADTLADACARLGPTWFATPSSQWTSHHFLLTGLPAHDQMFA